MEKDSIPLLNPLLIERRVLHALPAFNEVAVHAVNQSIFRLNHRRVVVRTGRLLLEMPRLRPGPSFVTGERYSKVVPTLRRVVVNQQPLPALEPEGIKPRARTGQIG